MTNGRPDRANETSRAAARLGVAPGTDAAGVRAAFLGRLEEVEFVPPPDMLRAFETLGGRALPGGESTTRTGDSFAEESRVREELETLAADFFSYPVAERRRRWEALAEPCRPFPALAVRLRSLGAGLNLEPGELQDPDLLVVRLAGYLGELFVLSPPSRAVYRHELLARLKTDIPRWEAAAQALKQRHPAFAELEPVLLGRLAGWSARQKQRMKARKRVKVTAAASDWQRYSWIIFVVIAALGTLFRGINSVSNPHPPSTVPHFQPFAPDRLQDNDKRIQDVLKDLEKWKKNAPLLPGGTEKRADKVPPPFAPLPQLNPGPGRPPADPAIPDKRGPP
jgi:hypothetical protein